MSIPMFQVDAFTTKLYSGNPAAVMLLSQSLDDAMLQNIAAENNLAETAFLIAQGDGYGLRWFTPTVEVDLCGHATLASAHVLFSEGIVDSDVVEFYTLSGTLIVSRNEAGYTMDFPVREGFECDLPADIRQRLPVSPQYVERFGEDYLVVLDEPAVLNFEGDFFDLPGAGGVILTAAGNSNFDMVSRFFGFSGIGIREDSVTGSIHCQLAHYWSRILGKQALSAYQASARGGQLQLQIRGDRVLLQGQAVTFFKGEAYL